MFCSAGLNSLLLSPIMAVFSTIFFSCGDIYASTGWSFSQKNKGLYDSTEEVCQPLWKKKRKWHHSRPSGSSRTSNNHGNSTDEEDKEAKEGHFSKKKNVDFFFSLLDQKVTTAASLLI